MDEHLLIGRRNALPWHLPEDLKRFREITAGWTVVMGKNTYFSLPEKFRPLPNRRNIVISREKIEGIETFSNIDSFLDTMIHEWVGEVCLIGGATLYDQFFEKSLVDEVELTLVHGDHIGWDGNIYVQEWRDNFNILSSDPFKSINGYEWEFIHLVRK